MAQLTNQDETQLMTTMLSTLQEALTFVQNMQMSIDIEDAPSIVLDLKQELLAAKYATA